jgi:hypothetical protein
MSHKPIGRGLLIAKFYSSGVSLRRKREGMCSVTPPKLTLRPFPGVKIILEDGKQLRNFLGHTSQGWIQEIKRMLPVLLMHG